jgi:GrpB-like predicted nucleotidyltransferase (UPF0157 family)
MAGVEDLSPLGLARGTVRLAPYDPAWRDLFAAEAARLRAALGGRVLVIEHVGSTSIPGMDAKPILDMMAAVPTLAEADRLVPLVEALGYELRPDPEIPERRFFVRGRTTRRTHHFSLAEPASRYWRDTLLFRDWLRAHPEAAEEYRALKHALAARHATDREKYTNGKEAFVHAVLARARAEHAARPSSSSDSGDHA